MTDIDSEFDDDNDSDARDELQDLNERYHELLGHTQEFLKDVSVPENNVDKALRAKLIQDWTFFQGEVEVPSQLLPEPDGEVEFSVQELLTLIQNQITNLKNNYNPRLKNSIKAFRENPYSGPQWGPNNSLNKDEEMFSNE